MERIVIASDDNLLPTFGHIRTFTWTSGTLPDDEGDIVLRNSSGIPVDSVHYSNQAPWPAIADNSSIALMAPYLENNSGSNWIACPYAGTPGIPYIKNEVSFIKINEFSSNNDDCFADENDEYDDWFELVNLGTEEVDLGGAYLPMT